MTCWNNCTVRVVSEAAKTVHKHFVGGVYVSLQHNKLFYLLEFYEAYATEEELYICSYFRVLRVYFHYRELAGACLRGGTMFTGHNCVKSYDIEGGYSRKKKNIYYNHISID